METLLTIFPDPDTLLAMAPEELGPIILKLARQKADSGGLLHVQAVTQGMNQLHGSAGYPQAKRQPVERAIEEAWSWLKVTGLIISESGSNGNNGWHFVSRRAARLTTSTDWDAFRRAAAFPKSLLHSSIADSVWLELARGDLSTAVFKAFRAVEEAVREAAKFPPSAVGTKMMRDAFGAKGPLTDQEQPVAEQEALANLFASAIGSYKNPHSHRTVTLTDPLEAQEIVMLASHLLRIVESRRPAPKKR